jgi:hypothetical protein
VLCSGLRQWRSSGKFILFIFLIANGFLPGGSGTTIRHIAQITHIAQNNTPPSNKHVTQNYKNNEGHTTHNEYNANTIITRINKKISI